jgi:GLPGLI family protein
MKKLITILLLCISLNLVAQQEEPLAIIVEYKLTHVVDSTQPKNPFMENFLLLINKNYSWYDRYAIGIKKIGMTGADGTNPSGIPYSSFTEFNKNTLVKNFATKKMYTELYLSQTAYSIEEDIPILDWKLQPETKVIADLSCQKASASYKGRNYTAWFTNKIPYRTGPWKFSGLPGLILEVYDEKKEVQFNFVSFYTPNSDPISIGESKNTVKITAERYKKMQAALADNPGAVSGVAGARSGNVVASNIPIGSASPTQIKPRKANNPIEKE